jgi:hypothetical protein
MKTKLLATVVTIVAAIGTASFSQDCKPLPASTQKSENAANGWMLTPVDIQAEQDSATPAERHARDTFWDKQIGATAQLYSPLSRRKPRPMIEAAPIYEEFTNSELRKGVWLAGTFESYRSYLSASQLSIYTEIKFRVSHILGHPKSPSLHEGSLISIGRAGGTIRAPRGKVVSYDIQPKTYDFQPGHTYLVAPTYVPEGDFYLFSDRMGLRWDVADGTAKPDTLRTVVRSVRQCSSIAGLPIQSAIEVLTQRIEEATSTAQPGKWSVFSSPAEWPTARWSIQYPADWDMSSRPEFVNFSSAATGEAGGSVTVQPLVHKPSDKTADEWLANLKKSRINPISEERLTLHGSPALRVRYRAADGGERETVYVVSGANSFDITLQSFEQPLAVEKLRNYPIYLKMVATFSINTQ